MKKILIFLSLLIIIFGVCATQIYASTSSGVSQLYKAEELIDAYKSSMKAPYEKDGDDINKLSGAVNYEEEDLRLPGKNGTDLSFIRTYDSLVCDREIMYRYGVQDYVQTLPIYKFDYILNGTNLSVWVNISNEEDLVNTITTTAESLNNMETDDKGTSYCVYSSMSKSGDLTLERDKTQGMEQITVYKRQNYSSTALQNMNIKIGAGWELKMPYLTYAWEEITSSTRTNYFNFFQDIYGNINIIKIRIYESYSEETVEEQTVYSHKGYKLEIFRDNPVHEEGFVYNVKITDEDGLSYYFEQSRWYGQDVMPKAVIDKYGNKIMYTKSGNSVNVPSQ